MLHGRTHLVTETTPLYRRCGFKRLNMGVHVGQGLVQWDGEHGLFAVALVRFSGHLRAVHSVSAASTTHVPVRLPAWQLYCAQHLHLPPRTPMLSNTHPPHTSHANMPRAQRMAARDHRIPDLVELVALLRVLFLHAVRVRCEDSFRFPGHPRHGFFPHRHPGLPAASLCSAEACVSVHVKHHTPSRGVVCVGMPCHATLIVAPFCHRCIKQRTPTSKPRATSKRTFRSE